ncbi:MAG: multidrug ABC transporter ATP-binding protein [Thermoprotei archaeon]|nr:MAG: multidrug ABC transporter ATP-binding protein [Thermoprotei archaeon]
MIEAVNVKNLVKIYSKKVKALDRISFHVEEGEIFGLIGPNGAGKTTTLRIISTLLKPTSGEVTVYGIDVVKNPMEVKKIISYLPEESGAYKNLKGREFIRFIARLNTDDSTEEKRMVEVAEEISQLGERLDDKISTYSKGMLRRLLLAVTLMRRPKLAILDEPTSGLDVINANRVRRIIKKYIRENDATALVSSHNMLEVEYLCDRVAIIHKGRIIAEGEPQELKSRYNASNLEEVFLKVIGI